MRYLAPVFLCAVICATANAQLFRGRLDGIQENPDVVTDGAGFGTAHYDPATHMLAVNLTYSGLTQPTTDAHIHCCSTSAATNAGVAIGFTGAGGFVTGSTSGNYSHTFNLGLQSTYNATYFAASGGTVALARDRLINAMTNGVPNNSGLAYFNLHTGFRPGGEIRGNIFIPEPASALLLLCGLTSLGFTRRRRQLPDLSH